MVSDDRFEKYIGAIGYKARDSTLEGQINFSLIPKQLVMSVIELYDGSVGLDGSVQETDTPLNSDTAT